MVSNVDIRFHHFYLVVLQGDMVGFAKAFPVSAREGVAKFWNTLYIRTYNKLYLKIRKYTGGILSYTVQNTDLYTNNVPFEQYK